MGGYHAIHLFIHPVCGSVCVWSASALQCTTMRYGMASLPSLPLCLYGKWEPSVTHGGKVVHLLPKVVIQCGDFEKKKKLRILLDLKAEFNS